MDPFTEKELIDNLKSIALSLREIRAELADLNNAVRELNTEKIDEDDAEDVEEEIKFEDPENQEEDNITIEDL